MDIEGFGVHRRAGVEPLADGNVAVGLLQKKKQHKDMQGTESRREPVNKMRRYSSPL